MVVAEVSAAKARLIDPSSHYEKELSSFRVGPSGELLAPNWAPEGKERAWVPVRRHSSWARNVNDIEVVFIGKAAKNMKPGIVLASFHAG